jgi:hypothetical protein
MEASPVHERQGTLKIPDGEMLDPWSPDRYPIPTTIVRTVCRRGENAGFVPSAGRRPGILEKNQADFMQKLNSSLSNGL